MVKSVLSVSVVALMAIAPATAFAEQGQPPMRASRGSVAAQTIGTPNSGSVTCYTGTVIAWGPAPTYVIHTAAQALAMCPDKKPDGPRVYSEAPRINPDIRTQVTAASGASATDASDASDDANGSQTGKVGQAGDNAQHPTDPLPPAGFNDGVPVLNCSKSANNPPQVDLSTGQPGWTLVGPAGAVGIVPAGNVSWSAIGGAQWVGPATPATVGFYTYKTRVRLNACPRGQAAQIAVIYRADNIGTLFINGVQAQAQAGTFNYGFLPASQTTKTVVMPVGASGIQTIELRVQNTSGPTGLAANVQVTR